MIDDGGTDALGEPSERSREFADAERLTKVVQAAFGSGRRIVTATRLANGSKKGVYRLLLDDRESVIVYVWNTAEDYWHGILPEGADDPADPFSHASGLDLFEAATRRLEAAGVRSPRLLLADRSGTHYPGDVAVVEDVSACTLEALLERDPVGADLVMGRFSELVDALHGYQRPVGSQGGDGDGDRNGNGHGVNGGNGDGDDDTVPAFGKVGLIDSGGLSNGTACEQVIVNRALAEVAEIASADPLAAAGRKALEETLYGLAAQIQPRTKYGLVHGELGPDHVLVGKDREPVLIDIEGLMYFDVEWEHVCMRLRFGEFYGRLANSDRLDRDALDEQRLRLYRLAMHLSLVAGPRRIAAGDHPAREWFLEIADYHLQQALEAVG
ncbi:MAG TPA: phosphotransferase [Actinocrinis sp.]|nr:phosphotransferase [Actinocrinis sp.]